MRYLKLYVSSDDPDRHTDYCQILAGHICPMVNCYWLQAHIFACCWSCSVSACSSIQFVPDLLVVDHMSQWEKSISGKCVQQRLRRNEFGGDNSVKIVFAAF